MTKRPDTAAMRIAVSSLWERIRAYSGPFSAFAMLAVASVNLGALGSAKPQVEAEPKIVQLSLLENGDMDSPMKKLGGVDRIPWWTPVYFSAGSRDLSLARRKWDGAPKSPRIEAGVLVLESGGPDLLVQAVPTFEPLLGELRVTGRVLGAGTLVALDAAGREYTRDVGGTDAWQDFSWDLGAEGALTPRLTLGLGVRGEGAVRFDDLAVWVSLPAPTEAELRAQLGALIPELIMVWHEGSRDKFGPRETNLWVGLVDSDTGGLVGDPAPRVGLHPMHMNLVHATRLGLGGDQLRELCVAVARDFMELCIQPQTHLPRRWDPIRDVPVDLEPIEVGAYLGYLLDLAQHGPEQVRDEALVAATAMGEALLEKAVLPNGNVAALVRPIDGEIFMNTVHLRRLNLPARFARLGALLQERGERDVLASALVDAAKNAVLDVEFANYWPGKWNSIDPGFDDSYGNIGASSASMLVALPGELMLGRLAFSGLDRYAPLWRDAMAHGGNIAADQVRCWKVFGQLALLQPERLMASGNNLNDEVRELLAMAVRSHLKGEQATGGHWLDVTVVGFDPATNLPVGDTVGMPQNLIKGLGYVYREEFGLRTQEHRAIFAAVLASTLKSYQGTFGLVGAAPGAVPGGGRGGGARTAVGTIQIMDGLLEMAENLDR